MEGHEGIGGAPDSHYLRLQQAVAASGLKAALESLYIQNDTTVLRLAARQPVRALIGLINARQSNFEAPEYARIFGIRDDRRSTGGDIRCFIRYVADSVGSLPPL